MRQVSGKLKSPSSCYTSSLNFRRNFSFFLVAILAAALELAILSMYWSGTDPESSPFHSQDFILQAHAFLLAACGLLYLAARFVLRPVESILEGIAQYSQGRFGHRIEKTAIRELDLVAGQLNSMASRLGELDEMKSQLAANVSHELRSPLAAMEQYADLISEGSRLSGQDKDNLARIQANLARLRTLVENMLSLSQLEAGSLQARAEPFSLAEAVEEAAALLAPKIAARKLSLEISPAPALPRALADRDKTLQILINLLDNAVKYNRDGGKITVSFREDGGALTVAVSDTGFGIPAERMGALFERFRRIAPASPGAPKTSGVGLGLAISRGLARAMGGELRAESREGQGSEFLCTLPAAKEAA